MIFGRGVSMNEKIFSKITIEYGYDRFDGDFIQIRMDDKETNYHITNKMYLKQFDAVKLTPADMEGIQFSSMMRNQLHEMLRGSHSYGSKLFEILAKVIPR